MPSNNKNKTNEWCINEDEQQSTTMKMKHTTEGSEPAMFNWSKAWYCEGKSIKGAVCRPQIAALKATASADILNSCIE